MLPRFARQVGRRTVLAYVLMIAVSLLGSSAATAETSDAEKAALSTTVGEWIKKLTDASENEHGKKTKRGYFSRDFRTQDGKTYLTAAHIETGGGPSKITERFELSIEKKDKAYEIVGEELKDTFMGMHRDTHAVCHPYDGFKFDREGIDLRSGAGTICIDYYQGRASGFRAHGENMTYTYAPPEHVQDLHLNRDMHALHEGIRKDHARELDFPPAAFLFSCDPDSCDELLGLAFTGLNRDQDDKAELIGKFESRPWDQALVQDTETEREKNPFAHYRRPYQPGNKAWSVYVPREIEPFTYPGTEDGVADFGSLTLPGPGVHLVYNNWGGFEVEFSVYPRRLDIPEQLAFTVYGYYSKETLENTEPYSLEQREDAASRWHQVYSVKGDVSLGLQDPETLEANLEFGIEIKQPAREIPFSIQSIPRQSISGDNKPRSLLVNSVQLNGEEVTWTRTSQLGGLIVLPTEMPAGTKLNLHMDFSTRALYKVTSTFTYVSRFGWMPFVRFGDFIDEFELTIRNPATYKVLGIGHRASIRTEGQIAVTHWKADSPVVFPSIAYGRYEESDAGKSFEPARTAAGTAIPVVVHVDKSSFEDWDIRPSSLQRIAQQAVNAINLYSEISGLDYPYGELNFVNDPQGFLYGQAPSSLIYLGSGVFRGEGSLAPFFNDATSIAKFLKSVTAHEVGHQWWGSRVSNANDRNYWFVESLAEYFSALYLEVAHGPKDYQEQVDEWRRTILDRRIRSTVQASYTVWGGEDGGGAVQANIYNKGPFAFHMLRQIFGDEKFFKFLKEFSMELAAKREIVTMDIQLAAEKGLGGVDAQGNPYNVDLSWFFDQWIRGVGLPQYSFNYAVRQTEDLGWVIEGKIKQRVVVGSGRNNQVLEDRFYRGVVDIVVAARGNEYKSRVVVEGPETPFQLKVPEKPVEVTLNKYNGILAHDVLVNQSW